MFMNTRCTIVKILVQILQKKRQQDFLEFNNKIYMPEQKTKKLTRNTQEVSKKKEQLGGFALHDIKTCFIAVTSY